MLIVILIILILTLIPRYKAPTLKLTYAFPTRGSHPKLNLVSRSVNNKVSDKSPNEAGGYLNEQYLGPRC